MERSRRVFGFRRLYYRFIDGKYISIEPAFISLDEPAICVNMQSYFQAEIPPYVEDLFGYEDTDAFISAFCTLDIAKIMLMIASAHSQIPKERTYGAGLTFFAEDFPERSIEPPCSLREIQLNLQQCTRLLYRTFYSVAECYGITKGRSVEVPILIDHVYFSNVARCEENMHFKKIYAQTYAQQDTEQIKPTI